MLMNVPMINVNSNNAVMNAVSALKSASSNILNKRQQEFNKHYGKTKSYSKPSYKKPSYSRPSGNKVSNQSPGTRSKAKASGPLVAACVSAHNKPMGSLAQGKYCYVDSPKGTSKSCDGFLKAFSSLE